MITGCAKHDDFINESCHYCRAKVLGSPIPDLNLDEFSISLSVAQSILDEIAAHLDGLSAVHCTVRELYREIENFKAAMEIRHAAGSKKSDWALEIAW